MYDNDIQFWKRINRAFVEMLIPTDLLFYMTDSHPFKFVSSIVSSKFI